MKTAMDNECMYLEIEDATSCHVDVFDYPRYKYHCAEKNKDLPFGIFNCHKCTKYKNTQSELKMD